MWVHLISVILFGDMFLDVDLQKIHFEEFLTSEQECGGGVKSKETLVLLHGWGGNTKSLRPLAEMIAPHDKTILIDLPGFGESSNPPKTWGVEEYTKCIGEFVKKMGFKDVVLVGHSFGATIALSLASEHLDSIKKVVLCAPSYRRAQKPTTSSLYSFAKPIFEMFPFVKRVVYKMFYPNSDLMRFPHLQDNFKKIIHDDCSGKAKQVKIPTLILWGSEDNQTPVTDAHTLHSLIPHSLLEIYPDHTHNLPVKFPEIISKRINDFLKNS